MVAIAGPRGFAPSRRWFWLLLGVSVGALILAGTALAVVLTRGPPTGQTTAYATTFVVGSRGGCGEILGWSGYCDMVNFSLAGGNTTDRLVLLEVSLNETCPSTCYFEIGGYPRNVSTWQGIGFDVTQTASQGGVLWGGSEFLQVEQSTGCARPGPSGCPHVVAVTATIQVEDYGSVPAQSG